FLQGEALDERLKRERKLPIAEILRIGRETAEGLAAAHEHGLIHRDIKPGNLWLERLPASAAASVPRCRVKILDFGLVRTSRGAVLQTEPGTLLGTAE